MLIDILDIVFSISMVIGAILRVSLCYNLDLDSFKEKVEKSN